MSILSDLFKGKPRNLPNNVKNIQDVGQDGTKLYLGSQSLTWSAKQRKEAIAKGIVKPDMAYSEQELIPDANYGVWATNNTVESQVEQREEMPRG